jgi:hypothetical protein
MLSAGSPGEAMLCYQYVLCAAGGDEGSHSNCSGLNFKWARSTLQGQLGQATSCGSAAPGPIWPSTRLDDSSRMPLRAGPGAIQIWPSGVDLLSARCLEAVRQSSTSVCARSR